MSKQFKSLDELAKYLEPIINSALEKEVAQQARKTMKEAIQDIVYDKYEPTEYDRLYDDSRATYGGTEYGLQHDESIYTGLNTDGELLVRSTRRDPDSPSKDIPSIIEYGTGYDWEDSRIYARQPFPRPFHAETAKRLDKEELAKKALEKGLNRQGIDTK